ncbi:hypothetical protein BGZ82_000276 [Podila clonocystis]|nr:hypothetical protein BGZ82_000276 [Podila clonocystis]
MSQPLWGIVDGWSTSKAFSVRMVFRDPNVDDLKKLIKEARAPLYNHVPADKILLSMVSIPDDPASELEPIHLKNLSSPHRPLRATETLWRVLSPEAFVYDLKKGIKDAKSPMFDHIPADEIQVSKAIIEDDPDGDPLTIVFMNLYDQDKSSRPLRAHQTISSVFGLT